ncbi:coproporphyrinogen III oxidase, partial [Staphylococcus pseudintermedius]
RLTETTPTVKEQIEEEMFLGLRMNTGVDKIKFQKKYHQTIEAIYAKEIISLEGQNLIDQTDTHIALTDKGRIVGNTVFEAFIQV